MPVVATLSPRVGFLNFPVRNHGNSGIQARQRFGLPAHADEAPCDALIHYSEYLLLAHSQGKVLELDLTGANRVKCHDHH